MQTDNAIFGSDYSATKSSVMLGESMAVSVNELPSLDIYIYICNVKMPAGSEVQAWLMYKDNMKATACVIIIAIFVFL